MMRLYHFTPEKYALSGVAQQRLKISRIADLNDPFELLAAELSQKRSRSALGTLKSQLHDSSGLLCFTKHCQSPLLWSHYADKHRGICLGFDIPDDSAKAIEYDADRFDFDVEGCIGTPAAFDLTQRLLYTKFKEWAYEEEVRVYMSLDSSTDQDGLYFADFGPNLSLREVILGPRCEVPIAAVRSLVTQAIPTVSVIKARLAFKSFSVVQDRRFSEGASHAA
jgi:hypothetical protein